MFHQDRGAVSGGARDTAQADEHLLDESLLVEPDARRRPWREFLESTPGRLSLLAVALVAVALTAGIVTSVVIDARQQRMETLRAHTEPLADAAQHLFSSLSVADAAATSSFIAGAIEPLAVRDRYNQAIADASNALVTASYGVTSGDVDTLRLLTEMSRHLAVYTDLVATARSNDAAGNPVGVAYLGTASGLMQDTILPLAERLYNEQSEAVADTQSHTARLPVTAIVVASAGVVVLAAAHTYVAHRSRRRINPGLACAAVLLAALVVWIVVAGLLSTSASERARTDGAEPLAAVTKARILAQQARADETLGLLRPGFDPAGADYTRHMDALTAILNSDASRNAVVAPAIDEASAAFEGWRSAHRELQQKLTAGDYQGAADIAVGPGSTASTATFRALDEALDDAITTLRTEELDAMRESYRTMAALAVAGIVLAVTAAVAVIAGIEPRVGEYH
ncbi:MULTISPECIES: hypothetical protein [unclassified Rhodococcus (in: high G+C Gram-positive bacteria)]|uniref:hypothetical protein n=1 Tax=unclassified Rhodococcus (in: high G+C Gram-positive bacteria) TaxID=192944 RepID=UPI00163B5112|nr:MULTISPECIES: hypothetical protein [unclassified Rhodococcus (in: high G+C Gram-positive bacteria)]MBC2637996.1 hypothetical protein [Rhodococcus sp. 3A]MBC2897257.1 hypothetical protein [Rhodococcus sp. 4CII]